MNIENYLRSLIQRGIIDFHLRAEIANDGRVTFCIHPDGKDGETADFEVAGNQLSHNRDIM